MSPALHKMMPKDFLRQLPEVQDVIHDDECPVCLQKYVSTTAPVPGITERLFSIANRRGSEPIETEHAVRLPCQHVLGSDCIKRWISEGGQNTCPYCVQQLFTRSKYPVGNHPTWDKMIDLLRGYGFIMNRKGRWLWNQTQGAAAISSKDYLDTIELANRNISLLAEIFPPSEDTKTIVQRIAAARLTVPLREAVLYLQLQSHGVDLPAIEEAKSGYPYLTLEKHEEDALFDEFERRKIFDRDTSGRSQREIWESERNLGMVPEMKWK